MDTTRDEQVYEIPDTREGWVESLKLLLESYFHGQAPMEFDYSKIRPEGDPISGFGGVASGHKPLEEVHEAIRKVLENNTGEAITEVNIKTILDKGDFFVARRIWSKSDGKCHDHFVFVKERCCINHCDHLLFFYDLN